MEWERVCDVLIVVAVVEGGAAVEAVVCVVDLCFRCCFFGKALVCGLIEKRVVAGDRSGACPSVGGTRVGFAFFLGIFCPLVFFFLGLGASVVGWDEVVPLVGGGTCALLGGSLGVSFTGLAFVLLGVGWGVGSDFGFEERRSLSRFRFVFFAGSSFVGEETFSWAVVVIWSLFSGFIGSLDVGLSMVVLGFWFVFDWGVGWMLGLA